MSLNTGTLLQGTYVKNGDIVPLKRIRRGRRARRYPPKRLLKHTAEPGSRWGWSGWQGLLETTNDPIKQIGIHRAYILPRREASGFGGAICISIRPRRAARVAPWRVLRRQKQRSPCVGRGNCGTRRPNSGPHLLISVRASRRTL